MTIHLSERREQVVLSLAYVGYVFGKTGGIGWALKPGNRDGSQK